MPSRPLRAHRVLCAKEVYYALRACLCLTASL
jgi:hypothetical protein